MLTVAQLAPLKERGPYLYKTLVKIVSAVNATSQRSGVDPSTPSPAATPIASLYGARREWRFDLAVTDPTNARPGLFSTANIHRIPNLPEIPPDIASYKLYYVNYKLRLFNGLWMDCG